jgi:hypothetical protein
VTCAVQPEAKAPLTDVPAIERAIVQLVVQEALRQGYRISVDDGGDDYAIHSSTDEEEIMKHLLTTAGEKLHLYRTVNSNGGVGWVGDIEFVYGNSGYDVISDYTSNPELEAVLAAPNALANRYEDQENIDSYLS